MYKRTLMISPLILVMVAIFVTDWQSRLLFPFMANHCTLYVDLPIQTTEVSVD